MPQRRLLHADASGLTAYRWHAGVLHDEGRFDSEEEGQAAFAAYLRRHRHGLFYLLADLAEEGFQYEAIPFVRGSDRTALMQRKLNQFFYGSTLVTAWSLGRESEGRRDERVLFAALTRPQILEPWLTVVREEEIQLAGVYSVPLLAPSLAKRLKVTAGNCLIVSMGRAGIRQTFIEGGKLRFSRLSPLATVDLVERARACAAETVRLYQYLAGQRVLNTAAPLPVLVLTDPAHHSAFDSACVSSNELEYHPLDLAAIQRQQGLNHAGEGGSADALYLHLLALRPPAEQFAPPAERHLYRIWQMRFALKSAGALALAGCLLFAGAKLYEADTLKQAALKSLAEAGNDSRRYAEAIASLPPIPTSMDNLRAVMSRFEALEARSPPPQAMLARISRALDASPDIEIDRIGWEITGHPEDANPGARRTATAPGHGENKLYATATVEGTLPHARAGNQRAMLDAVSEFATELRRDGDLQVSVLRMPVDVESARTLRSGGERDKAPDAPKFSVRASYAVPAATRQ